MHSTCFSSDARGTGDAAIVAQSHKRVLRNAWALGLGVIPFTVGFMGTVAVCGSWETIFAVCAIAGC